jgi:hypothetical protein
MMIDSGLPGHLWPQALQTACYTSNFVPSLDDESPRTQVMKQAAPGTPPASLSFMRRFGCLSFAHIPEEKRRDGAKFAPRAVTGYLVGYHNSTTYKIYIPGQSKLLLTPSATFNEEEVYKTHYKGPTIRASIPVENNSELSPQSSDIDTLEAPIETLITSTNQPTHEQHLPYPPQLTEPVASPITPYATPNIQSPSAEAFTIDGDRAIPSIELEAQTERAATQPASPGQATSIAISQSPTPAAIIQPDIVPSPPPDVPITRRSNRLQDHEKIDYKKLHSKGLTTNIIAHATTVQPDLQKWRDLDDPCSQNEAHQAPDADHWHQAEQAEYSQLLAYNTFEPVRDLPPGRTPISGKWVYKKKKDSNNNVLSYKARWVARGFEQVKDVDYFDTFAPTLRTETLRLVLALAGYYNHTIVQLDVVGAFLHSTLNEDIYMQAPKGFGDGMNLRVRRSLYGLKQAPNLWYQEIKARLLQLNFVISNADTCLFIHQPTGTTILLYVDDLLIIGPDSTKIQAVKEDLKETFSIKEITTQTYRGLNIERTEKGIRLHQQPYAKKVLERFNMLSSNPVSTPMINEEQLNTRDDSEAPDLELQKTYQECVGCLIFLSSMTRPDMTYTVNKLGRYMHNPSQKHWKAAKHLLRYLNGTQYRGIPYNWDETKEPPLIAYTDSDWGSEPDTRRSTSGSIIIFLGGPIYWESRLQKVVATSSTEAEYIALSEGCRTIIWIRQLLQDLQYSSSAFQNVTTYCDNQAAIALALNERNHKRSKHIDIKYHFIRDQIKKNIITLQHCPTTDQRADGLTKALEPVKFNKFLRQLRVD